MNKHIKVLFELIVGKNENFYAGFAFGASVSFLIVTWYGVINSMSLASISWGLICTALCFVITLSGPYHIINNTDSTKK